MNCMNQSIMYVDGDDDDDQCKHHDDENSVRPNYRQRLFFPRPASDSFTENPFVPRIRTREQPLSFTVSQPNLKCNVSSYRLRT